MRKFTLLKNPKDAKSQLQGVLCLEDSDNKEKQDTVPYADRYLEVLDSMKLYDRIVFDPSKNPGEVDMEFNLFMGLAVNQIGQSCHHELLVMMGAFQQILEQGE